MDVVAELEAGRAPERFDHRAHLAACWAFLRRYGLLGTLDRLPAALRRTVAALGQPDRYHETLTWAWILAVADRWDDSPDAETFLARNPDLRLPDAWRAAVDAPSARERLVPPGPAAPSVRRVHGSPSSEERAAWIGLAAAVFEGDPAALIDRIDRPGAVCWVAEVDEQLVGFKLGFPDRADVWHSTLGGVAPSARRRGVARALMRAQHQWAKDQGYRLVTTSTRNRFRAMLALNLSEGFDVVGVRVTPAGEPKILLEKRLDGPGWSAFDGPP